MLKVSVIVPAYNAEKTVCATVESLLNQSYKNIEIIVVNDGSHDRTAELLQQYGNCIRVIDKENGGVSSARNMGIKAATGELLAFADADDLCNEDMISSLVDRMQSEQVDYVIAGYTRVKGQNLSDSLYGDCVFRGKDEIRNNITFILANGLNSPFCKMYSTRIVRENGIMFDQSLPLGEDLNFNLEYLLNIDAMAYLNKPVYQYMVMNSVATTIYREDLYQRRLLSLEKMNTVFTLNGLENPIEGSLRIKILYAVIFNLQKDECPYSFREKIQKVADVKKEYFAKRKKGLSGIHKLLEYAACIMPACMLYSVGFVLQKAMRILPEKIRGVSV